MPLLMTRGTASLKSLGFGASGESNWLFNLYTTVTPGREYKVRVYTIDKNASNIVCSGYQEVTNEATAGFAVSVNLAGEIAFQKSIFKSAASRLFFGTAVNQGGTYLNSAGNISCFGRAEGTGGGTTRVNLNSSGSFVSAVSKLGTGVIFTCRDTSGNFITINPRGAQSSANYLLAKFNAADVYQWSASIDSIFGLNIRSITSDSSNNIYVIGDTYTSETSGNFGGTNNRPFVVKYDSSGTMQWQKQVFNSPGSYIDVAHSIAADSSGNVYIGTNFYPDGRVLIKLDSSGSVVFRKKTPVQQPTQILIDGSSIYTLSPAQFCKYDTSGNIVFARSIGSNKSFECQRMIISGSSVFITGYSETGIMILNLPLDGSKTGSYVVGDATLTYGTITNPTITDSSLPVSDLPWTHTTSSGTYLPFEGLSSPNFSYTPSNLKF